MSIKALSVSEYEDYLDELRDKVKDWKDEGCGYVSIRCRLTEEVVMSSRTDNEKMFTATQLKEIFELAK